MNGDDARPELQLALDDLPELYFAAKDAVLFYEVRERRKALGAIIDLRDVLDHIMLATEAPSAEQRKSEVVSAREHLRRAAVEPIEWAVENRLTQIMRKLALLNFCRILFIPPPSSEQLNFLIERVQTELTEGRTRKNAQQWREAIGTFKSAYSFCGQLDDLLPSRDIYAGRVFQLLLLIMGAALGCFARHLFG